MPIEAQKHSPPGSVQLTADDERPRCAARCRGRPDARRRQAPGRERRWQPGRSPARRGRRTGGCAASVSVRRPRTTAAAAADAGTASRTAGRPNARTPPGRRGRRRPGRCPGATSTPQPWGSSSALSISASTIALSRRVGPTTRIAAPAKFLDQVVQSRTVGSSSPSHHRAEAGCRMGHWAPAGAGRKVTS